MDKSERIRKTMSETRQRRASMTCKVFTVKVQRNKLNKGQREHLKMLFTEAKWLYNHLLSYSQENDVFKTDYKQHPLVTHYDKDGNPIVSELKYLSSQMAQGVAEGLKTNIKNLAKAKKKGCKIGSLKYISEYGSINLKQAGVSYRIKGSHAVKIQGMGRPLRVNGLEQILSLEGYELANAKLLCKPSGYYIAITVYVPRVRKERNGKIGVDFGCQTALTLSDGRKINATVEENERLKRLQNKMARSQKGSNNRRKIRLKVRKEYERLTNKKDDLAHKVMHTLDPYYIVMQDEQISVWKRRIRKEGQKHGRPNHGKAVQHGILGRVKSRLMEREDVFVIHKYVPTTKLCTCCGHKHNELRQWDREFVCPHCGARSDRDVHAAENMVWLQENIIGVGRTEYKPVEFAETVSGFFGHLKQEAAETSVKR